MKVGLYFGSFNPIHIGHMAVANYMLEFTDMDQLWFVISPHNPLKTKASLLPDYQRYELVYRAIGEQSKYKACNIEFSLPKPSYTVDTLAYLYDKYPKYKFALIMGMDSLETIPKWKNYKFILENYEIYVYPRTHGEMPDYSVYPNIKYCPAPIIELSSTFIRNNIKEGKNMCYYVPSDAYKYLKEMHFYEK